MTADQTPLWERREQEAFENLRQVGKYAPRDQYNPSFARDGVYSRHWNTYTEMEAHQVLIKYGGLSVDDAYDSQKARHQFYSHKLSEFNTRRTRSKGTSQTEGATPPPHRSSPPKAAATPAQKIASLQVYAGELIADGTAHGERIPLMRAKAQELEITMRDQELVRLLWDARRMANGAGEPLAQGDEIDLTPTPWCWQTLVMAGCLNLMVSLPKIGKTSLLLAWIAAWHRGSGSFLGCELIGPCPPVLIVGTDQPGADWGRMLQSVGLLEANGSRGRIQAPIVALFHAGKPLHLDAEGIERISSYAMENHGLLVIVDSLAACMRPLGLAEESADFAGPIGDLMEAVEPHGATVVAIHHSNKGRAGESATMASRGGTALPAVASQLIKLGRIASKTPNPADRRLTVETDGRGGLPVRLLIERLESGDWISYGDADCVTEAQRIAEMEDELTDSHHEALEAVREICGADAWITAAQVVDRLQLKGRDAERSMRRRLDSMVRRGLLESQTVATLQGRQKQYRPLGVRTPQTPTPADVSYPSDVSDPLPVQVDKTGKDQLGSSRNYMGSDGADTSDASARVGGMVSAPALKDDADPFWPFQPGELVLVTDTATGLDQRYKFQCLYDLDPRQAEILSAAGALLVVPVDQLKAAG